MKQPVWLAVHALTGARPQATVEYFDLGWYGGFFEAPSAAVDDRLPPGFEPIEVRPGTTELEVWCGRYRRIDILHPYGELAVIVPARFAPPGGGAAIEGRHVMDMIVTTEEARWTGAKNYGFPKVVGDVLIEEGERAVEATAHQAGRLVLSVRSDVRPTEPFAQEMHIINVRDDGKVTSCSLAMSGERAVASEPGGVTLHLGEHAIADRLRQMQVRLETGRALFMPHASGVLGRAIEIGSLPSVDRVVRHAPPAAPPVPGQLAAR